jgi:hypothetical protein
MQAESTWLALGTRYLAANDETPKLTDSGGSDDISITLGHGIQKGTEC